MSAVRTCKTLCVPGITGRIEVNLTVRDPAASASWYSELLGMEELYDSTSDDGRLCYVALVEPASRLVLCLVGHADNQGQPFSELHTGLDHLEFLVDRREDLDEWAARLDELGVEHSGVKEPGYTANAMLTFRDPDNIALEFFWRAPAARTRAPEEGEGRRYSAAAVSIAATRRTRRDLWLAAVFLWITPWAAALSIRFTARRSTSTLSSAPVSAAVTADFERVRSSARTDLLRRRRFSFWRFRLIWLLMLAT